jgi:hypothetical protein
MESKFMSECYLSLLKITAKKEKIGSLIVLATPLLEVNNMHGMLLV